MYGRRVPGGRGLVAVVVVAALVALAGCGGSDDGAEAEAEADTTTSAADPTSTTAVAAADLAFDGPLEDFYRVPDPLPAGEPGELIRVQELEPAAAGTRSVRVMYHSRDAQDRDRAVGPVDPRPVGEEAIEAVAAAAHARGTGDLLQPGADVVGPAADGSHPLTGDEAAAGEAERHLSGQPAACLGEGGPESQAPSRGG